MNAHFGESTSPDARFSETVRVRTRASLGRLTSATLGRKLIGMKP